MHLLSSSPVPRHGKFRYHDRLPSAVPFSSAEALRAYRAPPWVATNLGSLTALVSKWTLPLIAKVCAPQRRLVLLESIWTSTELQNPSSFGSRVHNRDKSTQGGWSVPRRK